MSNKKSEKVYDVSFHIISSLDQSGASEVFEQVRSMIEKRGEVLSADEPELMELAYTIRHNVRQEDGSYARYADAYFVSIKCVLPAGEVESLQKELQENESILRFIAVETVSAETRTHELPSDKAKEEGAADEPVAKR